MTCTHNSKSPKEPADVGKLRKLGPALLRVKLWSQVPPAKVLSHIVWVLFAICNLLTLGQETIPGRIKDFSLPEYFSPPNENQLRSLLQGAEAELRPDNTIVIYKLHAITFRQTGELELEINAPVCHYNPADHVAYSSNALEVRTGDSRLKVRGEGFLWQQHEAILIISNHVHCILRTISTRSMAPAAAVVGGLLNLYAQTTITPEAEAVPKEKAVTEIFADHAQFDLKLNEARYSGNVRVVNPVLNLRCDQLTARLPANAGHIESIIAERNVEFDAIDGHGKRIRGTGQKAVYTYNLTNDRTNELVELTGNPVLHTDQGTLTAEVIVFDRVTGRITATNPRMTVAQPDLTSTNAPAQTNLHPTTSQVTDPGPTSSQANPTNTPTAQMRPEPVQSMPAQ